MQGLGDIMSIPPMDRDLGSTLYMYQTPIMGMGMMGYPICDYGYTSPRIKQNLSEDRFIASNRRNKAEKSNVAKTLCKVAAATACVVGLVLLKKSHVLKNVKTSVTNWFKNLGNKNPVS